jgi:hypothetical protein
MHEVIIDKKLFSRRVTHTQVIFDKKLRKTRGYGFVSFRNAECFSKALREMQVRALAASASRACAFTFLPHALCLGQVHWQPTHHHPQE